MKNSNKKIVKNIEVVEDDLELDELLDALPDKELVQYDDVEYEEPPTLFDIVNLLNCLKKVKPDCVDDNDREQEERLSWYNIVSTVVACGNQFKYDMKVLKDELIKWSQTKKYNSISESSTAIEQIINRSSFIKFHNLSWLTKKYNELVPKCKKISFKIKGKDIFAIDYSKVKVSYYADIAKKQFLNANDVVLFLLGCIYQCSNTFNEYMVKTKTGIEIIPERSMFGDRHFGSKNIIVNGEKKSVFDIFKDLQRSQVYLNNNVFEAKNFYPYSPLEPNYWNHKKHEFNTFDGFDWKLNNELSQEPCFLEKWILEQFTSDIERDYVLNWIASIIQKPYQRRCVLVLYGLEGAGKSRFQYLLNRLIGSKYTAEISDMEKQLFGNHNTVLENKLLINASEMKSEGKGISSIEQFKTLATESTILINPKGVRSYNTNIFASICISTNYDDSISLTKNNRRFSFVDFGKNFINNEQYFINLTAKLDDDKEIEKLFNRLLVRDLSNFAANKKVKSDIMKQQYIRSLTPIVRFFGYFMLYGNTKIDDEIVDINTLPQDKPIFISSGDLYTKYVQYMEIMNYQRSYIMNNVHFGRQMKLSIVDDKGDCLISQTRKLIRTNKIVPNDIFQMIHRLIDDDKVDLYDIITE